MVESLIVFSGGMDSTVLLCDNLAAGRKIAAISFDYGSKHNPRELAAAASFAKSRGVEHRIVKLPFINELFDSTLLQSGGEVPDGMYDEPSMKVTVVPFRNGIMLAVAAGYAESIGAEEVLLASHRGDHYIYPDCRPAFNEAFAQAAWIGTGEKVAIRFPYADLDKREIADRGRELGLDLGQTWTCYKGRELHCGTCGACQERKYALRYSEGEDPTRYES